MFRKRRMTEAERVRLERVRTSELCIVVDDSMTHAHGPYSDLRQAASLAQLESAKSGKPHHVVAFEFTTGMVIKPEEIEAAMKELRGTTSQYHDGNARGYL